MKDLTVPESTVTRVTHSCHLIEMDGSTVLTGLGRVGRARDVCVSRRMASPSAGAGPVSFSRGVAHAVQRLARRRAESVAGG